MIEVRKSAEPDSLRQARRDGASWNAGFYGKPAVRATLIVDQVGICAYCERGVRDLGEVEHFHPRSIHSCRIDSNLADDDSWGLTWSNLFVSCGHDTDIRSCNSVKRDRDLCDRVLHPASSRRPKEAIDFSIDTTTGDLGSDHLLAAATIEELQLNRAGLSFSRRELVRYIEMLASLHPIHEVIEIYCAEGPPIFVTTMGCITGLDPLELLDRIVRAAGE